MSDVVRNNAPNHAHGVVNGENIYVHNKVIEIPSLLTEPTFDDEFYGPGVTADGGLQPFGRFQWFSGSTANRDFILYLHYQ